MTPSPVLPDDQWQGPGPVQMMLKPEQTRVHTRDGSYHLDDDRASHAHLVQHGLSARGPGSSPAPELGRVNAEAE